MGHDHHDAPRAPYNGQAPPFEKIPLPQLGTKESIENIQAFDNNVPMPPARGVFDRFMKIMRLDIWQDAKLPYMAGQGVRTYESWSEYLFSPWFPLKPKDYVDAYSRPNPCPEEHWMYTWRWPRVKYVNPKIPPPQEGKYRDYYHYLAFKNWLERERDVYCSHANLVHEAVARCAMREGQYNAMKNCKHLANKSFAMSRAEELNQTLLYMAYTGNCAIRETPYPADFLEEKRKIYDDWLFRTRMRKPGDVA